MQESAPDKVFLFFIYLLMILILLIILVPLLYVVSASFSDPQAVISGEMKLLPVRPTLRGRLGNLECHSKVYNTNELSLFEAAQ